MNTSTAPRKYRLRLIVSILLFCLLWLCYLRSVGAEVSPEQAETLASRFLAKQLTGSNTRQKPISLQLTYVKRLPGSANARQSGKPLYYVFNNGEQGFVIVSGDDAVYPILGFSHEGSFKADHLPDAFRKWVAQYEKQIQEAIKKGSAPHAKVTKAWEEMGTQETQTVGPLLRSKWNQSPFYNDLCPMDHEAGQHVVTGCVATAMAQIMYYYKYPQKGNGFHSYQHERYGTLSADFGLATYQWDQMPEAIDGPNEAVALLNYHCGVAVDMDYGVNISGAAGTVLVKPALQNFFGYEAEYAFRSNFSQEEWVRLLQAEFDAGRPVYYQGFGSGTGHAFVCDGYQDDEFFHFNWGWGGMMDGFYFINDLSPAETGTGGGNGSYNSDQSIVYQIKPKEQNGGGGNPTAALELYSEIQVNPNPVYFANPFTVEVSVVNWGNTTFNGKVAALITNQENFTEILDSVAVSVESGYYNTLTFPTEGIALANPGTYSIYIFSKTEGVEWKQITSEEYSSSAQLEILGPDNDITLFEPMEVTGEVIVQNQPFDVTFNVINHGEEEFSGTLYAALYDLDGYYQAMVDSVSIPSLPAGNYYIDGLTLHADSVNLAPGSYLLALISASATDTLLLAGGEYLNPVTVVVQGTPLAGDAYENNDTEETAFSFETPLDDNTLVIKTEGANQHTELDYDYYQIKLPEGGNYQIDARVHDNYESQDGKEYTTDVIFSYKIDSEEWSNAFDTKLGESLSLTGGTVTFWVSPYFAGQKGTYALEITVNQGDSTEPFISLTSPAKGNTWLTGSSQQITWKSNVTGKVTLALYQGSQLLMNIAEKVENTGSFAWQLPESMTAGEDYQVVIYSVDNEEVKAQSEFFQIKTQEQQHTLTLKNPNQGTSWEGGSTQQITWESNFTGPVTLELHKNQQLAVIIAENAENTGSFTWAVPDSLPQANHYQVMIYETGNNNVKAISEFFIIDRVTGVDDDINAQVSYYPNPVVDQVNLTFEAARPRQIALYSAQGVKIQTLIVGSSDITLDMRQLPEGLYVLYCDWSQGKSTTHKILKQ